MRGFFILVLICLLFISIHTNANAENSFKGHNKTDKIERLLQKKPDDKKLLNVALENAMTNQDWNKAIFYNDELLKLEPDSENLLKNKGDLYFLNKDITNAINIYKELAKKYDKNEYFLTLAKLYIAKKEFIIARLISESLYQENPDNPEIADALLESLLGMHKTKEAYWFVKNNHLEKTKNGYTALGDIAIMDKNYKVAMSNYTSALELNPESLILKDKLKQSRRLFKNVNSSPQYYYENLDDSYDMPDNIETQIDTEYSELERSTNEKSRVIFYDILSANPNYVPTKTGLTRTYLGTSHDLSILEALENMPVNDKTKLLKAQAYYNMNMWTDAKEIIKDVHTKEAEELKYKIRKTQAIVFSPSYSFFSQQLADEFDLDIQQFGARLSKNIDNNKSVFLDYNVIIYSSGRIRHENNVTHEFKGGIKSRFNEEWEYRGDLGVKVFEYGHGDMIITDSWIKHYFNDKFNLKIGFRRDNIEQTYLSAVGRLVNGIFTGRAADNKLYAEYNLALPYGFYAFGFGSYGAITAQNLPTNQYTEGMIGIGKLLYNNPKNKWINTFGMDVVSYNSAYQYNLLKIPETATTFFGGYFSPSYYNATTVNLRVDGNIKKWHLKYGIDAFGGVQTAMSPDMTIPAWGVAPYISYDVNENLTINVSYDHFVYADVQRDQFIVNAIIRGFKKRSKN